MAEIVDATKTMVITLTPPSAIISCTSPTPHYSSGCALLLAYDRDNDGIISFSERSAAIDDGNAETITASELKFVSDAYTAGSINALCTGCYTPPYVPPTPPPPPPPTIGGDPSSTATRKSLAVGDHNITITKSNYETVVAKINVSSKGEVTCESVTGGSCGGTGYPRVEATGTSVKVYMATGVADGKCAWINAQTHNQTHWISELIKAYFGRTDLGFAVEGHSAYISSAIKVYFGRGTIAEEFGC